MEALKGWLQLHSAGLLEVSGKARQIVTESQSFVQQRFATLVDQCQFSDLTKQCQQFLVKLSQQSLSKSLDRAAHDLWFSSLCMDDQAEVQSELLPGSYPHQEH